MTLKYKIISDLKLVYVRGGGKVTADDILTNGQKMFEEHEWFNGLNILCDYRDITEFDVRPKDIEKVVNQDKNNKILFDKGKCGIVACSELIFGYARMWEILSEDNKINTMVFKNIDDCLRWLDIDVDVFESIKELPS